MFGEFLERLLEPQGLGFKREFGPYSCLPSLPHFLPRLAEFKNVQDAIASIDAVENRSQPRSGDSLIPGELGRFFGDADETIDQSRQMPGNRGLARGRVDIPAVASVYDHRYPGQPRGRAGVEKRSQVMRVDHIGPPAAKEPCELDGQARQQPAWDPHRGHRPAQGIGCPQPTAPRTERHEAEVHTLSIGKTRKFDESLLLATHHEFEGNLDDPQTDPGGDGHIASDYLLRADD